ncbi:hypothetical protein Tco_0948017 [Tanacetum coccineum]
MAQQVIPAAQLVPRYHTIGRCNNYVMLQSIPCSPECKIVGHILLDHPLSYALTATADVPVVFKLDTQEITYTMDMFRAILKLPVETPDNPFVAPVTIETIKYFMNKVDYQGVVDKFSAFCTKKLAQPWQTMFKVFNCCLTTRTSGHDQTKINILQLFHVVINLTNVDYAALLWWDFMNNVFQKKEAIQVDEDYYSIKDDTLLVSVYTIGNVLVQGMLIPDAFLTEEIRATDDFKKYDTVFVRVDSSGEEEEADCWRIKFTKEIIKITIRKKKQITTLIPHPCDDQERDEVAKATILSLTLHKIALVAKAQENIAKVQENWMRRRLKIWLKGTKMKNHMRMKIFMEKYDDDDVEKVDKGVKEKSNADVATGSMEFRKEKTQTPIPSHLVLGKHRGQIRFHIKNKFITHDFFMGKIREVLDHSNKVVPELIFAKTNEMINKEMPCLINLAVNKDREHTTLNLYPTTSSSTAGKSTIDLQQQLYLKMKSTPQDQAVDQELWEILKAKFEKQ